MNYESLQQRIARMQAMYAYEITEGFCEINAHGTLQHTTNESLGIDDDIALGLEDVIKDIQQMLRVI